MAEHSVVFIGVRGQVLALDRATGTEVWRTALKGSDFVNVTQLDGALYAATKGEIFAVDPASGRIVWHNTLKGLGMGFVTIAAHGQVPVAMAARRKQQDAAAGAAGAAAAG